MQMKIELVASGAQGIDYDQRYELGKMSHLIPSQMMGLYTPSPREKKWVKTCLDEKL